MLNMRLFIVLVFLSYVLTTVRGTCDVMKALKCTGYEFLSLNPLGIMSIEDADYLCSIIGDLEVCLKNTLGGCSITQKVEWVPVIDSANFICNRLEGYKSTSHCYLTKETFENFKNCTQHFSNAASCRSFETFLNCVLTPTKRCSLKGAEIINGLFTAFTGFHIKIMNCSLPYLHPMRTDSEQSQQTTSTLKPKQDTDATKETKFFLQPTPTTHTLKPLVWNKDGDKSYLNDEVPKPRTATVKNTALSNALCVSKVVYMFIILVILTLP